MESSNLIMGIDYTASNQSQGEKSFGGKSLHYIALDVMNPYQKVIQIIGRTLSGLDEDNLIPIFGFGDITTKNFDVFPLMPDNTGRYCKGFNEVLQVYSSYTPNVKMSGPTSFAPLIYKAISLVTQNQRKEYHILVIIADGQVSEPQETANAIIKASNYPLSIIVVGVGDGPWDEMEEYDSYLTNRKFDNFHFVNYDKVMREAKGNRDDAFALAALMEIPQQFVAIRKLNLL